MHDLPGATFGYMCDQELKMHEVSLRDYFWSYVRPGGENAQNELPGATFGRMCGQGLKMLKISFLGFFLLYVRPLVENAENQLPFYRVLVVGVCTVDLPHGWRI